MGLSRPKHARIVHVHYCAGVESWDRFEVGSSVYKPYLVWALVASLAMTTKTPLFLAILSSLICPSIIAAGSEATYSPRKLMTSAGTYVRSCMPKLLLACILSWSSSRGYIGYTISIIRLNNYWLFTAAEGTGTRRHYSNSRGPCQTGRWLYPRRPLYWVTLLEMYRDVFDVWVVIQM